MSRAGIVRTGLLFAFVVASAMAATLRTEFVARVFADHYFERLKADADVVTDVTLDAPAPL